MPYPPFTPLNPIPLNSSWINPSVNSSSALAPVQRHAAVMASSCTCGDRAAEHNLRAELGIAQARIRELEEQLKKAQR